MPKADPANRTTRVYLVAAGDYHDIDFARLELLKLLAEHENIRTTVASDFHDIDAIAASDVLLTYTCNVVPEASEQIALKQFVESGKRWFALHGTNAILEFTSEGVASPEIAPVMMQTLGTQFLAHPPIAPFKVEITDPDHELVSGLDSFDTEEELYLCRIHGNLQTLLHTRWSGTCAGWVESDWPDDDPRPVFYINPVGDGEVLYLNLGHCRGHYDMQPRVDYYPDIELGAWQLDVFYELLRRGIRYCVARST